VRQPGCRRKTLGEADAEAADELPTADETENEAGNADAKAVVEIPCIVLNGQLASPSNVWQAAKAQLGFQMMRDT
jgi:hypothetical protein